MNQKARWRKKYRRQSFGPQSKAVEHSCIKQNERKKRKEEKRTKKKKEKRKKMRGLQ
jgi:hypothetical protein